MFYSRRRVCGHWAVPWWASYCWYSKPNLCCVLQVSTHNMHSSSEDDDMESPFPNDLSLQQVGEFTTTEYTITRSSNNTLPWSCPLTFPGLLWLSDPTDDCQLRGSVWFQWRGVQWARWKHQVSLTQLENESRSAALHIMCVIRIPPNQSSDVFIMLTEHELVSCRSSVLLNRSVHESPEAPGCGSTY